MYHLKIHVDSMQSSQQEPLTYWIEFKVVCYFNEEFKAVAVVQTKTKLN